MEEKYHIPGKWWVSPSNYEEEVQSKFNFPAKIDFLDTTLRDGEQQAGIVFTKEEKIAIAKKLDAVGVQRIEAGTPATLKEDAEATREICDLGLNADIYCFVRNAVSDIHLAKECGVKGVIAEIIGSRQMLEFGKMWTFDRAVKACIEATSEAKSLGLKTTFFPADSSRADTSFMLDMIGQVYEGGGIDSVALVDTMGVLSPEGAAHRVRTLKKAFPDLPVEVHFHDDYGLSIATTIAGLAAGAEVAHVSVAGIGERAGGAPLAATALSLEALYGYSTGLDLTKTRDLAEFVAKAARIEIPERRAVIGSKIFGWETGLPTSLYLNAKKEDPLIMLPYHWEVTGQSEPELWLGKKSGKDNLKIWLKKYGYEISEDRIKDLLSICKEASVRKHGLLDEADFRRIVENFK